MDDSQFSVSECSLPPMVEGPVEGEVEVCIPLLHMAKSSPSPVESIRKRSAGRQQPAQRFQSSYTARLLWWGEVGTGTIFHPKLVTSSKQMEFLKKRFEDSEKFLAKKKNKIIFPVRSKKDSIRSYFTDMGKLAVDVQDTKGSVVGSCIVPMDDVMNGDRHACISGRYPILSCGNGNKSSPTRVGELYFHLSLRAGTGAQHKHLRPASSISAAAAAKVDDDISMKQKSKEHHTKGEKNQLETVFAEDSLKEDTVIIPDLSAQLKKSQIGSAILADNTGKEGYQNEQREKCKLKDEEPAQLLIEQEDEQLRLFRMNGKEGNVCDDEPIEVSGDVSVAAATALHPSRMKYPCTSRHPESSPQCHRPSQSPRQVSVSSQKRGVGRQERKENIKALNECSNKEKPQSISHPVSAMKFDATMTQIQSRSTLPTARDDADTSTEVVHYDAELLAQLLERGERLRKQMIEAAEDMTLRGGNISQPTLNVKQLNESDSYLSCSGSGGLLPPYSLPMDCLYSAPPERDGGVLRAILDAASPPPASLAFPNVAIGDVARVEALAAVRFLRIRLCRLVMFGSSTSNAQGCGWQLRFRLPPEAEPVDGSMTVSVPVVPNSNVMVGGNRRVNHPRRSFNLSSSKNEKTIAAQRKGCGAVHLSLGETTISSETVCAIYMSDVVASRWIPVEGSSSSTSFSSSKVASEGGCGIDVLLIDGKNEAPPPPKSDSIPPPLVTSEDRVAGLAHVPLCNVLMSPSLSALATVDLKEVVHHGCFGDSSDSSPRQKASGVVDSQKRRGTRKSTGHHSEGGLNGRSSEQQLNIGKRSIGTISVEVELLPATRRVSSSEGVMKPMGGPVAAYPTSAMSLGLLGEKVVAAPAKRRNEKKVVVECKHHLVPFNDTTASANINAPEGKQQLSEKKMDQSQGVVMTNDGLSSEEVIHQTKYSKEATTAKPVSGNMSINIISAVELEPVKLLSGMAARTTIPPSVREIISREGPKGITAARVAYVFGWGGGSQGESRLEAHGTRDDENECWLFSHHTHLPLQLNSDWTDRVLIFEVWIKFGDGDEILLGLAKASLDVWSSSAQGGAAAIASSSPTDETTMFPVIEGPLDVVNPFCEERTGLLITRLTLHGSGPLEEEDRKMDLIVTGSSIGSGDHHSDGMTVATLVDNISEGVQELQREVEVVQCGSKQSSSHRTEDHDPDCTPLPTLSDGPQEVPGKRKPQGVSEELMRDKTTNTGGVSEYFEMNGAAARDIDHVGGSFLKSEGANVEEGQEWVVGREGEIDSRKNSLETEIVKEEDHDIAAAITQTLSHHNPPSLEVEESLGNLPKDVVAREVVSSTTAEYESEGFLGFLSHVVEFGIEGIAPLGSTTLQKEEEELTTALGCVISYNLLGCNHELWWDRHSAVLNTKQRHRIRVREGKESVLSVLFSSESPNELIMELYAEPEDHIRSREHLGSVSLPVCDLQPLLFGNSSSLHLSLPVIPPPVDSILAEKTNTLCNHRPTNCVRVLPLFVERRQEPQALVRRRIAEAGFDGDVCHQFQQHQPSQEMKRNMIEDDKDVRHDGEVVVKIDDVEKEEDGCQLNVHSPIVLQEIGATPLSGKKSFAIEQQPAIELFLERVLNLPAVEYSSSTAVYASFSWRLNDGSEEPAGEPSPATIVTEGGGAIVFNCRCTLYNPVVMLPLEGDGNRKMLWDYDSCTLVLRIWRTFEVSPLVPTDYGSSSSILRDNILVGSVMVNLSTLHHVPIDGWYHLYDETHWQVGQIKFRISQLGDDNVAVARETPCINFQDYSEESNCIINQLPLTMNHLNAESCVFEENVIVAIAKGKKEEFAPSLSFADVRRDMERVTQQLRMLSSSLEEKPNHLSTLDLPLETSTAAVPATCAAALPEIVVEGPTTAMVTAPSIINREIRAVRIIQSSWRRACLRKHMLLRKMQQQSNAAAVAIQAALRGLAARRWVNNYREQKCLDCETSKMLWRKKNNAARVLQTTLRSLVQHSANEHRCVSKSPSQPAATKEPQRVDMSNSDDELPQIHHSAVADDERDEGGATSAVSPFKNMSETQVNMKEEFQQPTFLPPEFDAHPCAHDTSTAAQGVEEGDEGRWRMGGLPEVVEKAKERMRLTSFSTADKNKCNEEGHRDPEVARLLLRPRQFSDTETARIARIMQGSLSKVAEESD